LLIDILGRDRMMSQREAVHERPEPSGSSPREFRFPGNQGRVRCLGRGVLLEPAEIDPETWFEALDRFEQPFMPEGRDEPRTPTRRD
jgi:virulence-associated protein VagC